MNQRNIEEYGLPERELDLLNTNIESYIAIKTAGVDPFQEQVEKKLPFLTRVPFYHQVAEKAIFNTPEDYEKFPQWLKKKCSAVTRQKVDSVKLVQTRYTLSLPSFTIKQIDSNTIERF